MKREKSEFEIAFELRNEVLVLIDEVQKHTRLVAIYDNDKARAEKYPDLYLDAQDNLAQAEANLESKIREICDFPRNEVYRCLAQERARAVAMQEAHASAIAQVFNSMVDRMEEKRHEYIAKIEELEK